MEIKRSGAYPVWSQLDYNGKDGKLLLIIYAPHCSIAVTLLTGTENRCYRTRLLIPGVKPFLDRATVEAVSRWLPTVASLVRAHVKSCGVCVEES